MPDLICYCFLVLSCIGPNTTMDSGKVANMTKFNHEDEHLRELNTFSKVVHLAS